MWGKCSSDCSPSYRVRHRNVEQHPNSCGKPAVGSMIRFAFSRFQNETLRGIEDEYQLCHGLAQCVTSLCLPRVLSLCLRNPIWTANSRTGANGGRISGFPPRCKVGLQREVLRSARTAAERCDLGRFQASHVDTQGSMPYTSPIYL